MHVVCNVVIQSIGFYGQTPKIDKVKIFIKAKQSFWKQEINQLLSNYRKISYEANKIIKTDKISEETQQICTKLKLQENMSKMGTLMESKILRALVRP